MPKPKKTNRKRFIPLTKRCKGTKKDGTPCMMSPLPGDECCWTHSTSDAIEKQRTEARSKGGRLARAIVVLPDHFEKPSLKNEGEVREFCQKMIHLVGSGQMSPGHSKAIAVFVQQIIQMHDLAALEFLRELEKRIGRLAIEEGLGHEQKTS